MRIWVRLVPWCLALLVSTSLAVASGPASGSAGGLAGSYEGRIDAGPVLLELALDGPTLSGTLTAPGIQFGLQGEHTDSEGYGYVYTGQGTAAFEVYVQGDTLGLYLFELTAAGEPVMESVIELLLTRRGATSGLVGETSDKAPGETEPALATGEHATLTMDNALAFIEALEFVLAQIGYTYRFNDSERAELLQAVALNFPTAEAMDQLVLADARRIWEGVQANWPAASEEDKREFALGVLILAFGEETVAAWVGQAGGGGPGGGGGGGGQPLGSGSCATFEDCAGSFVDAGTWSDTFNAQGCWAAAGCSSFDSSTGTFDYGGY